MSTTTSSEQIAARLHTLVEGWNTNNVEAVVGVYAPNFVEEDVALAKPTRGADSIRLLMRLYRRAFHTLNPLSSASSSTRPNPAFSAAS